jgi:hypothetical protein
MLLASVPLREVQFFPLKFPWRARCARRSTAGLVALFQPALAGELRTLCVRGELDINLEIAHCTRHLIYRITLERRSVKSRLSTYSTQNANHFHATPSICTQKTIRVKGFATN